MIIVIILIVMFLFVVKSSSRKNDNILDPSNTGHYTRLRRYPNRNNLKERRIRKDRNNRI